jgi:hypothetical protein
VSNKAPRVKQKSRKALLKAVNKRMEGKPLNDNERLLCHAYDLAHARRYGTEKPQAVEQQPSKSVWQRIRESVNALIRWRQ